jgi:hypothetical protein
MHRPTRRHKALEDKVAKKSARSRRRGAKQKRWNKAIEAYKAVVKEDA